MSIAYNYYEDGGGGAGGTATYNPSFEIIVDKTPHIVVQGGFSDYTLTVTPRNGYTGTVDLSFGVSPEACPLKATCVLGQTSANLVVVLLPLI